MRQGIALSESGLQQASASLGVGLPELWAVMTVETRGCGFFPDKQPVILFERHWFRKLTNGRFDSVAPDLSNRIPGGYGKMSEQHERLARAVQLDRQAAFSSTSWGLGQVMGFNAVKVGYPDVEAMVHEMYQSEDAQFQSMINFIANGNLAPHLREGKWRDFAYHYNGPDFQKNKYDVKLEQAHARYAIGPLPNLLVRAAQLYLGYKGYLAGGVDGWYGPNTQKALIAFQKANGLGATGQLDQATFALLENVAIAGADAPPAVLS